MVRLSSEDIIDNVARGTIMSTATLSITNEQDGTLYIAANTFVHKNIDKAYLTVFLDKWNDQKETWIQIGKWDFERSKEEDRRWGFTNAPYWIYSNGL